MDGYIIHIKISSDLDIKIYSDYKIFFDKEQTQTEVNSPKLKAISENEINKIK